MLIAIGAVAGTPGGNHDTTVSSNRRHA